VQDIKTKHIITMPRGWIRRKKGSIKAVCIDMERKHERCFSIWKQRKHKAAAIKKGGAGQLENKGKHMGYWLVAAKKRWCWSR